MVFSSESFLGNAWELFPEAQVAAAAMLQYLRNKSDFRLVIYLRPQIYWFQSLYTQFIQEGRSQQPVPFVEALMGMHYASYSHIISDMTAILGPHRLVVRPHLPKTDTLTDFRRLLGFPESRSGSRPLPANVSVTPQQVEILRRANALTDSQLLRHQVRVLFQNVVGSTGSGQRSVFPRELQRKLISFSQNDWNSLACIVSNTHEPQTETIEAWSQLNPDHLVEDWAGSEENLRDTIDAASEAILTAAPLTWQAIRSPMARARRFVSTVRRNGLSETVHRNLVSGSGLDGLLRRLLG